MGPSFASPSASSDSGSFLWCNLEQITLYNVNHVGLRFLMMLKKICLIIILIIKKGENVNNASFDDVEKNSLANDCHHQKGRDCECMNT